MKSIIVATLLALGLACGYSHVGKPFTTFQRPAPPVGGAGETPNGPLVLRISRHIDTILRGPDTDEDQLLVLKVHDFELGKRIKIPSENVTAEFTATRFAPTSRGETYTGFLIVRKITADKVDAYLHLDVTANTANGSYAQTAKFHGDYSFLNRTEDNEFVK